MNPFGRESIPSRFGGSVTINDFAADNGALVEARDARTYEVLASTKVYTWKGHVALYHIDVPPHDGPIVFSVNGHVDKNSLVDDPQEGALQEIWLFVSTSTPKLSSVIGEPAVLPSP